MASAGRRFTNEQMERYARHIVLPQVGGKGQWKLRDARVFIVGAGGLGSPILMYLAAAGVGTIEVIDDDRVDLSNLQRQIIHTTSRIDELKVESARQAIADINPDVQVITHAERLTKATVMERLSNADVIVEGSDNFPTRFLVADAAYLLRKPLVSGAMFRFEGQVTVFPNDGAPTSPCYRCLFQEPPPPGLIPSCQEAGIFGSVPGVIGSLQATEVIKLIVGIGEPLFGRLIVFDALAMKFREVRLQRDPDCPLNGDNPTITEPVEYEQTGCNFNAEGSESNG
ncbi:molybdopterin-synthase adenylyltransferase MoeB [bacterium]|nr:molybdopterin-synthase adenylyltransferase MoeB [bacterium]